MASSESEGTFSSETLQEHKLVQLDTLCKWFRSAFWRKPHHWACDNWRC